MRRKRILLSLALSGALLLGIMLGEAGVGSGLVNAAKVQLTGRLPLRDWVVLSPTYFNPKSGVWQVSQGDEERALYHKVDLYGVKSLELELTFSPIAFSLYTLEEKGGFQLSIESAYVGQEPRVETYSGQELEVISRATGGVDAQGFPTVTLVVPGDPDHRLIGIFLRFRGEPPLMWITIDRAGLILR